MLHKPWEVVGADIFTVKNITLLYIIDYYSKFPVIKKTDSLLAANLFRVVKIVFAEFGLPKKIVYDAGTNFMSDKYRHLCRQMNMELVITSLYNHQSNSQVVACIKVIRCTIKMP